MQKTTNSARNKCSFNHFLHLICAIFVHLPKIKNCYGTAVRTIQKETKRDTSGNDPAQLRDTTGGIRSLGKVEKLYLDNTNLIYTLTPKQAEIGNVRETFFMNQMRVRQEVLSSTASDFEIEGHTFEIGVRKKGQKQILSVSDGYVVKDDIETGYANVIPLWTFGMNY